ncbi:unnamed protein product [Amoebophrya sp. A120]|nr:unnamed protein product [Amoebophrya sp. A120]|eukprot:GSA120T00001568001.1
MLPALSRNDLRDSSWRGYGPSGFSHPSHAPANDNAPEQQEPKGPFDNPLPAPWRARFTLVRRPAEGETNKLNTNNGPEFHFTTTKPTASAQHQLDRDHRDGTSNSGSRVSPADKITQEIEYFVPVSDIPHVGSVRLVASRLKELQAERNRQGAQHGQYLITSLKRPAGPPRFEIGCHAWTRDADGNSWRVRIVDIDPVFGRYDCIVLDSSRTRLLLFEAELNCRKKVSATTQFLESSFGVAQDALGILSWTAALLQDLPRKWAHDYVGSSA